ncbi:MAG TPA: 2-C-methyl-D-erythritol 2,4-cyclodiphosphate synthase, partial [Deltaproteobacteria bacterium]|nr:2-C-methyl-D-erythritol 2,4-cyclodiphosphate synthase [Deltaproteobacteria bacterium]
MPFRIGCGFDVHAFAAGRKLILGGVEVPHNCGLDGHSDADVLTHAVMDALLGALALGDLGQHFPDTDPRYQGADSLALLREVEALIRNQGYACGNLDCTVIAQRPKLVQYILQMRKNLAEALQVSLERVSVKATTTERLGFTGREEGIAAQAAVLLVRTAGANKSGTFEKSQDKWAESVSDWGFYAERREKGRAWIHQKRKHL